MSKLPGFLKDKVERLIHEATHPTGMHTNGPTYVRIEASQLAMLLRYAQLAAPVAEPSPAWINAVAKSIGLSYATAEETIKTVLECAAPQGEGA
jgi:hypothetical protein